MTIHFIGIGGIGMSALASLLLKNNQKVTGSDKSQSSIIKNLIKMGADITIGHGVKNFDETKLVVYSTAIDKSNVELIKAKESNIKTIHRSQLLNQLLQASKSILVTGAHGKTSTSALLSWTLKSASLDPSYIIGGLLKPDFLNGYKGEGEYFVAEADESDGSFLNSDYSSAIVTNYDFDHVDFWESESNLKKAYTEFINKAPSSNSLIMCGDDQFLNTFSKKATLYGFSDHVDYQIVNYKQSGLQCFFDIKHKGSAIEDISLPLPGKHYALNAAAVFALCLNLGLKKEEIKKGLKSFPGVKRRLDHMGSFKTLDIFEDYAHHPKEVQTLLQAFKEAFSKRRIVAIFQPHRYSRLQAMSDDFAKALSFADLTIVTEVFSAGEVPTDKDCFSKFLLQLDNHCQKSCYFEKKHLLERLSSILMPHDVVLFIGAGDITTLAKDFISKKAQEIVF